MFSGLNLCTRKRAHKRKCVVVEFCESWLECCLEHQMLRQHSATSGLYMSLYDTRFFKIKEVIANTLWSIFNMASHYLKSVPWFTISMFLTFPHKTKSIYQLSRRLLVLLVFRVYLCWKAQFWDILHVWSFSCYQIFNLKAVKAFRWVCSHSVS